jgi:hypothetical protein
MRAINKVPLELNVRNKVPCENILAKNAKKWVHLEITVKK